MSDKRTFPPRARETRQKHSICGLERDTVDDSTLLIRALSPLDYAFSDYFEVPPYVTHSGGGGGILRLGVTDRMIVRRIARLRKLIRKHGLAHFWREEQIQSAINEHTCPYLDLDNPRHDEIARRYLWD